MMKIWNDDDSKDYSRLEQLAHQLRREEEAVETWRQRNQYYAQTVGEAKTALRAIIERLNAKPKDL